jgi:hypothetical protein
MSTSPQDQMDKSHQLGRWRLVLGRNADAHGLSLGNDAELVRIEALLGFLFEPGEGGAPRSGTREGGKGGSQLTVPEWVDSVGELFPRQAKEVLEREMVNRRGIAELLEEPKLLEKVEPNVELVKTLLTHKDLLNPKTRILARKIIAKVVEELKEKMKVQVQAAITGAIRRDKHSPRKVFRNLDRNPESCWLTDCTSSPQNVKSDPGTFWSLSTNPVLCSILRSFLRSWRPSSLSFLRCGLHWCCLTRKLWTSRIKWGSRSTC